MKDLICGLVSIALCAISVNDCYAVNMSFKGTLIEPPPCTVNGGLDINVSFNKVGVNKIDGDAYRQDIVLKLDCIAAAPPWTLALMLSTTSVASFSSSTIQSSIEGLGIKVYLDGQPLPFDKAIEINPSQLPRLEAVPISYPGVELTEGKFTASATLAVQYQ
ncbi:fimbrial protein [Serratia fonticola]|uniref:fimbrial protein n=1 Tax=Serratia fonticola TaxID=47917 RepID=UPI0034C6C92E